jgi:hypothetical protein
MSEPMEPGICHLQTGEAEVPVVYFILSLRVREWVMV